MKKKNIFGEGDILTSREFADSKVYVTSAACLTVFAEASGWANTHRDTVVTDPAEADHIVVLACQVTDIAILNDFNTIEKLRKEFPGKKYYIGSCLAQRFDIPLPAGVLRLDHLREDYAVGEDKGLVKYEKPFWVPDFTEEEDDEYAEGHLFRGMYPLRIGSGCHGTCAFCTIRTTRGAPYVLDPEKLETEFAQNDNIVILADSVTPSQIRAYSSLAIKYEKTISFRNVEPQNVVATEEVLHALADKGLLKVLHVPVQAVSETALKIMNRSTKQAKKATEIAIALKVKGVYVATNIITDYEGVENDFAALYDAFDYVSINPYWDGKFSLEEARLRWKKYIEAEGGDTPEDLG